MKKIVASFAVFFFLFSAPSVFAQMPLPVAGAVMPSGLERIGVVAAAGGKVELTTPGQVGRIAQSGQPIFMGDLVSTDAKGHLQILLLDETVFTIGPNSAITIDKFVYDPKTHGGEIKASVTKGVFRYVSGKIAVKNPNNVTVKLPTATLGFRGTIVGGSVEPSGQGLLGLLGPGGNNDAGAQTGSFTVEGQGGDQQSIDRTGFGVEVGADGGVSGVFQLSQDQVNGLTQGLGGGQGGGGGGGSGEGEGSGLGGDNMGDLSGETGALTGDNVGLTEGITGLTDGLNDLSVFVAQNEVNNGSASTLGSITTLAEMQAVKGVATEYHFAQEGVSLGASYTYNIYVNINFLESNSILQSVGGGDSRVDVYSGGSVPTLWQTFNLTEAKDFTSDSSNPFLFNATNSTTTMDLTLTVLNNVGKTVGDINDTAIKATHFVTMTDGSEISTGSGEAPRVDGLSPESGGDPK